jgi:4-hydroxythreonine-4-phosphate dehydrogenase
MDAPQSDPHLPLALTMGDAAGIGPELAILAWRDRKLHGLSPFAIYADLDLMRGVASTVGTGLPVAEISDARESVGVFDQALPIIPIPLNQPARAGEPTPTNGTATNPRSGAPSLMSRPNEPRRSSRTRSPRPSFIRQASSIPVTPVLG